VTQTIWLVVIVTFAGIVRGFSGFALSALVMATAVLFVPPIQLIPVAWWLELTASLLMVRGGWRDADRGVVIGLVVGSALGLPLGMGLTTVLDIQTSKAVALGVIVALAAAQLARIRLAFLATRAGLYGSGLLAGIVTGLASVGGLVVAIYVLSQDAPARAMRASLVLFLFLGAFTSMITFLAYGVMDKTAVQRGLALALPTGCGVLIGKALFTQKLEPYYRPFCLSLLILLASAGLARLAL